MAYHTQHIAAYYRQLALKAKQEKSVFTEWNYLDRASYYGLAANLKG